MDAPRFFVVLCLHDVRSIRSADVAGNVGAESKSSKSSESMDEDVEPDWVLSDVWGIDEVEEGGAKKDVSSEAGRWFLVGACVGVQLEVNGDVVSAIVDVSNCV